MLYNVTIVYEDGKTSNELIKSNVPICLKPKQNGIKSTSVSVHKYEVEQLYPPTLFTSPSNGKKYIIPSWIEVHPETTVDDINWTKPKLKKEIVKTEGSMGVYKTTYDPNKKVYKCTCMGYWRSKGNCKHVKALKLNNNE